MALLAVVTGLVLGLGVRSDVARFDLIENGAFAEPSSALAGEAATLIPWWQVARGVRVVERAPGATALRLDQGQWARQPIAAYGPLLDQLRLSGRVSGRGELRIVDGAGRSEAFAVGEPEETARFEISGAELLARLPDATPRLMIELHAPTGPVEWTQLACEVALPAPTAAALGADLERELAWIFDLWATQAADDVGPQATRFLARFFDVRTGEPLFTMDGGLNVYFELLMEACRFRDRADWRALLNGFLADYFELCLHPETGIPQAWDVVADQPKPDTFPEVAATLRFLLDLVERGPDSYRARAREYALKLGDTVLQHGVLPDGEIAPKYRARDGLPNTSAPHLRRLALPAQLVRLARVVDDDRYERVAVAAVANFEYSHYWPGTWRDIDPGFDDNYGNYGAHSMTMWRAAPDRPLFQRIARSGFEYYAPRWRDALRFGGNVAADQVRCWDIVAEIAELDPALRRQCAGLLRAAARSHFKGEQYGNGAWGDVTIFGFEPKDNLEVGDLPGAPQNLLFGLARLHDEQLAEAGGLDLVQVRAMFTAVLRSSMSEYKRDYGYLSTRRELSGANMSAGSLRLAVGMVEMLSRL